MSEFRLNGTVLPESPTDTVRWQEATGEKWSTLTFKTAKPVELDLSNGGGSPMRDINRTFELTGVAGGQRVFYYDADTQHQVLYLQDKNRGTRNAERAFLEKAEGRSKGGGSKNRTTEDGKTAKPDLASWIPPEALRSIGAEDEKITDIARSARRTKGIASERRREDGKRGTMILRYTARRGGNRVILQGLNEKKDSIYVVLDRVNRHYALSESTLQAGTY